MNLAVKLYKHHPYKPPGLPEAHPYEVRELGDSTVLPDESGQWQLMSLDEYKAYCEAQRPAWEEYSRKHNPKSGKALFSSKQEAPKLIRLQRAVRGLFKKD